MEFHRVPSFWLIEIVDRGDTLIEYRRFVTSVERDREFWIEVQRRYDTNGGVREAMAIMALMAESVLGVGIAPELMVAVDVMPSGVRCWVEQYAWKVVLAEYPGTKLYIILELALGQRGWLSCARMIFPSAYRPSRIAEADGTPAAKRRAQSLFFVTRLRYHIYESVPTLYELLAWRWAGARSSEGSSA